MLALYVTSREEGAGKTAICAGLGKHLLDAGKKVGYLRLATADGEKPSAASDDAAFMKQALALTETTETLRPRIEGAERAKEALAAVSQGKDVVIIEGRLDNSSYDIAKALNARAIIVQAYHNEAPEANNLDGYRGFGDNLLGVIINKVPESRISRARDEAAARSGGAGIKILGAIPEDRALLTLTVAELADCVHGEIINCTEKSAELVENIMLGAMVVDSGLEYFGRKASKAAIVRADRPDVQLAALETPTRCLVLSSRKGSPMYNVRQKADNKGIPIVTTEQDASAVVASIEEALSKARFKQGKKLPKLAEIMRQNLNFQAILQ